jgi:primosomal protein N' (replication factor Y)
VSDREVVVVDPGASAADVTRAWSKGRLDDGIVLVGTGRLAMWWVRGLCAVVLMDEGRRSHKERQTPTLHPRTILSHRARLEGFFLATTGLVPTLETVATGAPFVHPRRLWPLVEVIDRNEEPPGRGVLSERIKQAIRHAVNTRRTTLVFTHRRGYAPAFRCISCGELRRCASCASAATNAGICPRCGDSYRPCTKCGGRSFEPLGAAVGRVQDLMRTLVGPGVVGEIGSDAAVQVGTERDLAASSLVQLAVIVDGDRILLGTNFRAAEDGLRLIARVAGLVEPGAGNRAVVQTLIPDHPAMSALRHGDPAEFLAEELVRREETRMPPAGDLIVLETRGEARLAAPDVTALEADGAVIFGPKPGPTGERWLIQAPDLGRAKASLRSIVRRVRDQGSDVRVDVDPIEL